MKETEKIKRVLRWIVYNAMVQATPGIAQPEEYKKYWMAEYDWIDDYLPSISDILEEE